MGADNSVVRWEIVLVYRGRSLEDTEESGLPACIVFNRNQVNVRKRGFVTHRSMYQMCFDIQGMMQDLLLQSQRSALRTMIKLFGWTFGLREVIICEIIVALDIVCFCKRAPQ
jgi:hypothetical protein